MNIKCIIFGHKADCKMMSNPVARYAPASLSRDIFGNIEYHPPILTGWFFYSYVAICIRCKKRFDADDLDLPILTENDNSQNQSPPKSV